MSTPVTLTPLPVDALVTFDETTRTVLEELSETVASALAGIGRKNALVSPTVVRTEYDITGPTFVLTRLAREVAAAPENTQAGASGDGDGTSEPELTYRGRARQTEDGTEVFVAVERALTSTVVAAADRLVVVTDAQVVTEDEHGGVVRVWLSEPFSALGLADHGAVLRSVTATPDSASVVVNVPDGVTVGEISEFVRTRFEGVSLNAKRRLDRGRRLRCRLRIPRHCHRPPTGGGTDGLLRRLLRVAPRPREDRAAVTAVHRGPGALCDRTERCRRPRAAAGRSGQPEDGRP